MPPSAGACQTIEAALKPAWGRASAWSSTITAIARCRAASGVTRTPVRGAATRVDVGSGLGEGATGVGLGWPGLATPDALAPAEVGGVAVPVASGDGLAGPATRAPTNVPPITTMTATRATIAPLTGQPPAGPLELLNALS